MLCARGKTRGGLRRVYRKEVGGDGVRYRYRSKRKGENPKASEQPVIMDAKSNRKQN